MSARAMFRAAAVLALVATGAAQAAALLDPTRPYHRGASRVVVPAPPRGPVLQATRIAPGHKSAVISGRQVKIGDTFRGARIVDITSYEVRMRRGGRDTVLRLTPKLAKE